MQGPQLRQWLKDTSAVEGDLIAFKRQGSQVLVRRIPAADAAAQPAGGAAVAAAAAGPAGPSGAAAAKKRRQTSPEPEAREQLQGKELEGRSIVGAPCVCCLERACTLGIRMQRSSAGLGADWRLCLGLPARCCLHCTAVLWEEDGRWYAATVTKYDSRR